jgi:Domain of unknown function (DUF4276)
MTQLIVHVEGETEETFVKEILRPHLYQNGYTDVSARLLGNARNRSRRGGIKPWPTVKSDIVRHLNEYQGRKVTVMVDYYALPATGDRAWPGRDAPANLSTQDKSIRVENAIHAEICAEFAVKLDECRFIPFVLMHEFEALLFSDCAKFAAAVGRPEIEPQLRAIRGAFETPEDINDSPQTAPSKRVENLITGYNKPLFGFLAAADVGLDAMRIECPNFSRWLERLESAA